MNLQRINDTVEQVRKRRVNAQEYLKREIIRLDVSSKIAYGLCKKYGIDTTGMTPTDCWHAIDEYRGKWKAVAGRGTPLVKGPKKSKEYLDKRPDAKEIRQKSKSYRKVMSSVKNFSKDHPDAEDGTYDAVTGKMKTSEELAQAGNYYVTFHQNSSVEDPYADYTDDTYAQMCAVAMKDLGTDSVFIGYYGNPEVSFTCNAPDKAMKFAVEHNQESVYDAEIRKIMVNPFYDKKNKPDQIIRKE